jgi:hypothetical protein
VVVEPHAAAADGDIALEEEPARERRGRVAHPTGEIREQRLLGDLVAPPGREHGGVAGRGLHRVGDADDLAQLHRQADDRPHVRAALVPVGVEQGGACVPIEHEAELPRQVGGVA